MATFFSSKNGRVLAMYAVEGIKGHALFGFTIANLTVLDINCCLAMCLQDCRCMSFQICENQGCQLCSTDTDISPSAFKKAEGCTYFSFRHDLERVSSNKQFDNSFYFFTLTKAQGYNVSRCRPRIQFGIEENKHKLMYLSFACFVSTLIS